MTTPAMPLIGAAALGTIVVIGSAACATAASKTARGGWTRKHSSRWCGQAAMSARNAEEEEDHELHVDASSSSESDDECDDGNGRTGPNGGIQRLLRRMQSKAEAQSLRTIELYGWHFPELYRLVPDQLAYCQTVCRLGNRQNVDSINLSDVIQDPEVRTQIAEAAAQSIGVCLSDTDCLRVRTSAAKAVSLHEECRRLRDRALQSTLEATYSGRVTAARAQARAGDPKPDEQFTLDMEEALRRSEAESRRSASVFTLQDLAWIAGSLGALQGDVLLDVLRIVQQDSQAGEPAASAAAMPIGGREGLHLDPVSAAERHRAGESVASPPQDVELDLRDMSDAALISLIGLIHQHTDAKDSPFHAHPTDVPPGCGDGTTQAANMASVGPDGGQDLAESAWLGDCLGDAVMENLARSLIDEAGSEEAVDKPPSSADAAAAEAGAQTGSQPVAEAGGQEAGDVPGSQAPAGAGQRLEGEAQGDGGRTPEEDEAVDRDQQEAGAPGAVESVYFDAVSSVVAEPNTLPVCPRARSPAGESVRLPEDQVASDHVAEHSTAALPVSSGACKPVGPPAGPASAADRSPDGGSLSSTSSAEWDVLPSAVDAADDCGPVQEDVPRVRLGGESSSVACVSEAGDGPGVGLSSEAQVEAVGNAGRESGAAASTDAGTASNGLVDPGNEATAELCSVASDPDEADWVLPSGSWFEHGATEADEKPEPDPSLSMSALSLSVSMGSLSESLLVDAGRLATAAHDDSQYGMQPEPQPTDVAGLVADEEVPSPTDRPPATLTADDQEARAGGAQSSGQPISQDAGGLGGCGGRGSSDPGIAEEIQVPAGDGAQDQTHPQGTACEAAGPVATLASGLLEPPASGLNVDRGSGEATGPEARQMISTDAHSADTASDGQAASTPVQTQSDTASHDEEDDLPPPALPLCISMQLDGEADAAQCPQHAAQSSPHRHPQASPDVVRPAWLPSNQAIHDAADLIEALVPAQASSSLPLSDELQASPLPTARARKMPASVAADVLGQTGLPRSILREVWELADGDCDGYLDARDLALALSLCSEVKRGNGLPPSIPPGVLGR